MSTLDIFCDEAGFTGQNLLSREQRFFAYGSVAIDPLEATTLVAKTIRDFRLQGNELKGKNLLRHAQGRKAAAALIKELGQRSQVVIVQKDYALACKIFEYVFEPLLSDVSTALYEVNFHKYVGNLLYSQALKHHDRARSLLQRFEQAVRSDDAPLRQFLYVHSPSTSDPVEFLVSFCIHHRDSILQELSEARQEDTWVLDLTAASLNSLLVWWGRRAPTLRVVCDESGPLGRMLPFFDVWVGRDEKLAMKLGDRRIDFGFNLVAPIVMARSHEVPGIQLADVLSAVGVAITDTSDKWAKALARMLFEFGSISEDVIVPEPDRIDLSGPEPAANALILVELLRRSARRVSLVRELPSFIRDANRVHELEEPRRRVANRRADDLAPEIGQRPVRDAARGKARRHRGA
jgi:hypothetical protein